VLFRWKTLHFAACGRKRGRGTASLANRAFQVGATAAAYPQRIKHDLPNGGVCVACATPPVDSLPRRTRACSKTKTPICPRQRVKPKKRASSAHSARSTERRRRFRSLLAQFPPRCRSRLPECAEYVRSASIRLRERFASSSQVDPRFRAACLSTGEPPPRDAPGSERNSLLRSGSWNAFHSEERYFR
jgi:hypothetical protein